MLAQAVDQLGAHDDKGGGRCLRTALRRPQRPVLEQSHSHVNEGTPQRHGLVSQGRSPIGSSIDITKSTCHSSSGRSSIGFPGGSAAARSSSWPVAGKWCSLLSMMLNRLRSAAACPSPAARRDRAGSLPMPTRTRSGDPIVLVSAPAKAFSPRASAVRVWSVPISASKRRRARCPYQENWRSPQRRCERATRDRSVPLTRPGSGRPRRIV